ncbi:MAG: hypothetical protein IJW65_03245 [Clostridia bacterium]|nr:hypothetical protein [Clostridia bacterium]
MDKGQKKISKRARIFLLCVISVCLVAAIVGGTLAIVTLSRRSPVIMKHGEQKLRVDFYEFMLSRMKGELYKSKYDVSSEDFWGELQEGTDKTREQYYNEAILENCKVYLASLVIFDGLVEDGDISGLPEEYYTQIDEAIQLYIDLGYVGDGSEDKFNEILAEYGVDVDTLREIYIAEAKAQYVQEYIYGGSGATKIGDGVKQDYYEENYYRFKHILVGNFYYEYECETDAHGNEYVIYFDGETGEPLYDYENGEKRDDDGDGMYNRDSYDVTIAYDKETGEYLYDTENGVTHFVLENGTPKKFFYTDAQMSERYQLVTDLCSIDKEDFKTFEQKGSDPTVNTDYSESFATSSGIYMSDIESVTYESYMHEMLHKLKEMDVGEIAVVEAEDGYHVFRKYALDDGAYADENNEKWFRNFNSSLVTKMYLEKCQAIFDGIEINQKNLGRARSIKDIGINTDY